MFFLFVSFFFLINNRFKHSSLRRLKHHSEFAPAKSADLEYRHFEGLLSPAHQPVVDAIYGHQGHAQNFSLESSVLGTELCPLSFHDDYTMDCHRSQVKGHSNREIFGRLPGTIGSIKSGARCSFGGIFNSRSWFSNQLRNQILSLSMCITTPFRPVDSRRCYELRSSLHQDTRHPSNGECLYSVVNDSKRHPCQINWQGNGHSASLVTGTSPTLVAHRVSVCRPTVVSDRLVTQGSLINFGKGGSPLDTCESPSGGSETLPQGETIASVYRCSRPQISGLGLAPTCTEPLGARSLDFDRIRGVTKNPPQGILGSPSSCPKPASRSANSSRDGLKDRPQIYRSSGRPPSFDGPLHDTVASIICDVRAERRSHRSIVLDSRIHELGSRLPLPLNSLLASRARSTLENYASYFDLWIKWLNSERLKRSPQTLWLFLDSLRNSKWGRYARNIRASIIFFLKLSGEYFAPPSGEPPLSFSDDRIRMVAEGTEKLSPRIQKALKLPIRWFHLEKLVHSEQQDQFWLRDVNLIILGLFGMLRAGELSALRPNDFTFEDNAILMRFRRLKSDLNSTDTVIRIVDLKGFSFSPTYLVRQFVASQNTSHLFLSKYGKVLNADSITKIIQDRFRILKIRGSFTSHSLRVGGACFAAECGKSEATIKAIGGWKSNTILRYLRDIVSSFSL